MFVCDDCRRLFKALREVFVFAPPRKPQVQTVTPRAQVRCRIQIPSIAEQEAMHLTECYAECVCVSAVSSCPSLSLAPIFILLKPPDSVVCFKFKALNPGKNALNCMHDRGPSTEA